MKKILFENGTTIDGASTFNQMQNNVEEVFNGEEPMGSIVVEEITSSNLFNPNDVFFKNWLDESGQPKTGNEKDILTNFIKVKPNTKYTISGFGSTEQYLIVVGYSSSKTFNSMLVPSQASGTQTISFTTNTTDEYIRCAFSDVNMGSETLQIEKGEATPYKPHKEFSNKQHYSTNEQIIGEYLGKPLYRKTITVSKNQLLSGDTTSIDLGFIVEDIIDIKGNIKRSDIAGVTFPHNDKDANWVCADAYYNNNLLFIYCGSNMHNPLVSINITLEYTKGTDTQSVSTMSLEEE